MNSSGSHDTSEFKVTGHMINMEDILSHDPADEDPIGSPAVAVKRNIKLPEYWSHTHSCQCTNCLDIVATALDMRHFMVQVGIIVRGTCIMVT